MEKTYELLAGEKSSKLWQRGRDITKDQFDRIMAIANEKEERGWLAEQVPQSSG